MLNTRARNLPDCSFKQLRCVCVGMCTGFNVGSAILGSRGSPLCFTHTSCTRVFVLLPKRDVQRDVT